MRGDLFELRYCLPFVLHFAVLALAAIFIASRIFQRVVSWWFLISIVTRSLIVRRFLA